MALNKDAVLKSSDYIREAYRTNSQEFIIAFFLYEINGTTKEELTEELALCEEKLGNIENQQMYINKAKEISSSINIDYEQLVYFGY